MEDPTITKSPIGCTSENPDPSKFIIWCKKHKVLWPKCQTGVLPSTGRAVLAAQDIAAGEVVVEVPDGMVLMAENCDIADLLEADGLTKPADDALLEVQGLVLAVMHEKGLGPKSQWGPYLSFLPDDMSHMVMYWEESELAELEGTAAHDKLLGRVQHPADAPTRVRQLFEELVVPFVLSHERVACVLLGKGWQAVSAEDARDRLWQAYLWSTAAVASYSFVLGDEQYQGMVAVWDLLNHITGRVNVRLHHDPDKGVLQMIATEPIPKGCEVVNCYGQLSNAELLRGYGYVEAHNTLQHVQVPTHFCIKAAAAAARADSTAAAGPAAGKGRRKQEPEAAAAGRESGSEDDAPPSESEGAGSEEGEDDASSDDEGESSEASEPDWDLEDDTPEALQQQQERQQQYWAHQQQQQQQQQGAEATEGRARKKPKRQQQQPKQQQVVRTIPSLAAAQQQIPDWEERWQLCFSLGLLPKNGVIQVAAGGLDSCPGQLVAVLLLLLTDAADCTALAAASAAASDAAAKAAAAAAAAAGDGGNRAGSKQAGSKEQQQGSEKRNKKQQAGGKRGRGSSSGKQDSEPEDPAAAVKEELASMQFTTAARLADALQQLVVLMASRYPTTLQEDLSLLQQRDSLAPRLAAAVTARSDEKQVWAQLQQALQSPDAPVQVMQQARDALVQAVTAAVQEAAASATQRAEHHCCGEPGCEHTHHAHKHGGCEEGQCAPEHEDGKPSKTQGKKADAPTAPAGAGSNAAGSAAETAQGFSFNFEL